MALKSILVADDDAMIRQMLGHMLGRAGFDVTHAGTGRAAVEQVQERASGGSPVDLLMLDLNMPGMAGEEVFRMLDEASVRPKTIIITGDRESPALRRLKTLGCEGVLAKPFTSRTVMSAIDALPGTD